MGGGSAVQDHIDAVGLSADETTRRILLAVGAGGAYQTSTVGPGTIQVARTFRPRWAAVAGWITTVALCGAGLLLFLVKRTETCTITVLDGPTGATVTISGVLLPSALEGLRECLAGTSATAPISATELNRTPQPVVAESVRGWDDSTTLRGAPDVASQAAHQVAPSAIAWIARLDDGTEIVIDRQVIIGRNPAAKPDEVGAHLVALSDPGMSVSKTHLHLMATPAGVTVTDRSSTNGTEVVGSDGRATPVVGGQSRLVPAGCAVRFGDRTMWLHSETALQ